MPALDYQEPEPNIPQDGHIGLQIHGGGMAMVQVKNIQIEELPPTRGAPTWQQVGLPKPREAAPAKKDAAKEKETKK